MSSAATVRADAEACSAEVTRLLFDGTYQRVHEDVHDVLYDPIFAPRPGLTMDEAGRLAYDRARLVHSRLAAPSAHVEDPLRLFALAEWPSLLDVALFSLLMVHYNLCLGTLLEHGADRDDLADYRAELDGLSSFGPFMATELGYGNNVAALRTEAVYDPGSREFILNTPDPGAQKFMSYSGFRDIPKLAVVMARLKSGGRDHGVFPFMVRVSDGNGLCAGVRAAPCPEKPVQGLDNGLTWFDHVRLPRRSLLLGDMGTFCDDGAFRPRGGNSRQRFLRAMTRIQPGRICVASAAVGAGRASVYIALRYSMRRLTNAPGRADVPIIEYRSHQLALFTALAKTLAMTFLLNHAKREYLAHHGSGSAGLDDLISVTKALSTWEMTEVVAVCRERCGAQGMFSVNRIADYGSLLQGLVTAEGDSQVLLATMAGRLLARPSAVPATVAVPEGGRITDPAFQLELLRYREHGLRQALRTAMTDEALDRTYFDSWNSSINGALRMAHARGAALALGCFLRAAKDARVSAVGEGLLILAALYGLTEVERDAGWYLARGALGAEQVEGIPQAIDSLCERTLEYALMLTEGFQLSPELLRAPIAAEDYVKAYQILTPLARTC
jgi:acyl-CoA oxidase